MQMKIWTLGNFGEMPLAAPYVFDDLIEPDTNINLGICSKIPAAGLYVFKIWSDLNENMDFEQV